MALTLNFPFLARGGRYHDNDAAQPVLGDDRQQLVDSLHGQYYNAAVGGRLFSSSTTPLGVAIPIYTSVTPLGNVLWNPDGSGVNAVLVSYAASIVSGVGVQGAIGLMAKNGVGSVQSTVAASGPIITFTETTPVNANLNGIVSTTVAAGKGDGRASKVRSSSAGTNTFGTGYTPIASEWIRTMFVMPVNSAAVGQPVPVIYEFHGKVIVPPGSIVWVAATLASVALYAQTLDWEEVPL